MSFQARYTAKRIQAWANLNIAALWFGSARLSASSLHSSAFCLHSSAVISSTVASHDFWRRNLWNADWFRLVCTETHRRERAETPKPSGLKLYGRRCHGFEGVGLSVRLWGNSKAPRTSPIGSARLIQRRAKRSISARCSGLLIVSARDRHSKPLARYPWAAPCGSDEHRKISAVYFAISMGTAFPQSPADGGQCTSG